MKGYILLSLHLLCLLLSCNAQTSCGRSNGAGVCYCPGGCWGDGSCIHNERASGCYSSQTSVSRTSTYSSGGACRNTCTHSSDGECDDGGAGAIYSICALGTDCNDCGTRYTSSRTSTRTTNHCFSNTCRNGGTCINRADGYTCRCAAGYTGTNCGTNINECASSPCKNGGTCIDGVNRYTCRCAAGYTGTNCELNTTVTSLRVRKVRRESTEGLGEGSNDPLVTLKEVTFWGFLFVLAVFIFKIFWNQKNRIETDAACVVSLDNNSRPTTRPVVLSDPVQSNVVPIDCKIHRSVLGSSCYVQRPPPPDTDVSCCVCFEKEKNHAYPACGHKCVCESCAIKPSLNNKCPLCRRESRPVRIWD